MDMKDGAGRYEGWLDGKLVATSYYRDAGIRTVFLHTEVDADYAGRGLATQLVEFSLADVRAKAKRIVAQCPVVAAYLEKHHDFDDIVDHPAGVDGYDRG